MSSVSTQVKVVAWLHILLGALSLLGALFVGVILGFISALFGSAASGHALPGVLAGLGVGGLTFILVAVFAVPHFVMAWGLLNRAEWARVAGIILSILSLFHPVLGLGTAIAIYSLVVLFSSETEGLFRRTT